MISEGVGVNGDDTRKGKGRGKLGATRVVGEGWGGHLVILTVVFDGMLTLAVICLVDLVEVMSVRMIWLGEFC